MTERAGQLWETTQPAMILEPSPMVMGPMTLAPAPMRMLLPSCGLSEPMPSSPGWPRTGVPEAAVSRKRLRPWAARPAGRAERVPVACRP